MSSNQLEWFIYFWSVFFTEEKLGQSAVDCCLYVRACDLGDKYHQDATLLGVYADMFIVYVYQKHCGGFETKKR